jgi:hypothetical protein
MEKYLLWSIDGSCHLSHFPVCCWIDWLLMIKNCLIESGPPCIRFRSIVLYSLSTRTILPLPFFSSHYEMIQLIYVFVYDAGRSDSCIDDRMINELERIWQEMYERLGPNIAILQSKTWIRIAMHLTTSFGSSASDTEELRHFFSVCSLNHFFYHALFARPFLFALRCGVLFLRCTFGWDVQNMAYTKDFV